MICGHIHHAVIAERAGIQYCNTGDWVESCTAIVETPEGRLELIRWAEKNAQGDWENPNIHSLAGESGVERLRKVA